MRPLVPAVLVFGLLFIPIFVGAAKIDVGKEKCIGYPAYPGEIRPCPATVPNGTVPGVCIANMICKGEAKGDAGGFQEILKSALGILQQLMQQKQQKQQQQQPPPPPAGGGGGAGGSDGCTSYYQVTVPTGDKCAYYVPPASASLLGTGSGVGQSTASNELLNALNGSGSVSSSDSSLNAAFGEGGPSISEQLLAQSGANTGGETQQAQPKGTSTAGAGTGELAQQAVNLRSGAQGDIEVHSTGATVIARARDAQANTEVAGFYGSDTFGGQPQGVVGKLCQSRPWAKSVVTYIIPPSFFDSLCSWRGYQVGTPPPPQPPVVQQTKGAQSDTTTTTAAASSTPVTPSVAPQVDIWAVPEKVPLGARTSIFWNTKGVESCTISSPDGSFNEKSLSGGAATVPLSGATTFTISCLTRDGKPVTDYVTVQLAI